MNFTHCIGCGAPVAKVGYARRDGVCVACFPLLRIFSLERDVRMMRPGTIVLDRGNPEVEVLIDQWLEQRVNTPPAKP